jgi:hypothetical protein
MSLDAQSLKKILLRVHALPGLGDLPIGDTQPLQVEGKLAYFFEPRSLQDRPHRCGVLPSTLRAALRASALLLGLQFAIAIGGKASNTPGFPPRRQVGSGARSPE